MKNETIRSKYEFYTSSNEDRGVKTFEYLRPDLLQAQQTTEPRALIIRTECNKNCVSSYLYEHQPEKESELF